MALADPHFDETLLPDLRSIAVIGERLGTQTARSVLKRFAKLALFNTYGSTEANVVVDTSVAPEMLGDEQYLPLGKACPGVTAKIIAESEGNCHSHGVVGEIQITAPQVGLGYYKDPERTNAAFTIDKQTGNRSFRTGDKGWIDEKGIIHFIERIDFQIKVNGNRVELGDIEAAMNAQPEILFCCVVPFERKGACLALDAHVVLSPGVAPSREFGRELKKRMRTLLPEYMIPRTIVFHEALPMTPSGKIDRRHLHQNLE